VVRVDVERAEVVCAKDHGMARRRTVGVVAGGGGLLEQLRTTKGSLGMEEALAAARPLLLRGLDASAISRFAACRPPTHARRRMPLVSGSLRRKLERERS
jgi:hypothetical protein